VNRADPRPKSRWLYGALLSMVLAFPGGAAALSTGIWDLARPESGSCGLCHGPQPVLPNGAYPLPLLLIDGLPASYTPGAAYTLTVSVIGPVVPFGGFNLEATGGKLKALASGVPEGGDAQIGRMVDECQALAIDGACKICRPGQPNCTPTPCEVRLANQCPVYGPEHRDCACAPADKGNRSKCRACNAGTIVSIQATHTTLATVPMWKLEWTAPRCGYGDVKFYLAGNSVNGVAENDPADIWGVLPEPQSVAEGACHG
jgi:hypothetical protein